MSLTNSDVFMVMAMKAETELYSDNIMNTVITGLKKENAEMKKAILDFWHYASGECGARLYLELVFRLTNIERQAISYLV